MNCKPGDLAVIIDSAHPSNIGVLVVVMEAGEPKHTYIKSFARYNGAPRWWCESHRPLQTFRGCQASSATRFIAPDAALRPIRDPGEDAQDETLNWLPVPSQHKEVA
jgi:hypothetical protein